MGDYTLATKALHHFALDNPFVRKVGFDLDCLLRSFRTSSIDTSSPVYISGLARAGTTILLEALYSSGQFTTLTYRDMPFITSPFIWSLITANHYRQSEKKERAHADGLFINFDSPEAFEEVFWMTFADKTYIKEDGLEFHLVDEQVVDDYRKFVGNVLARTNIDGPKRYLAKNNNNILRISSLKGAFPNCVILVPFRFHLDHAKSLWSQHQKFSKVHAEDPFSLRYMNWLGHFEFGVNLKLVQVNRELFCKSVADPSDLTFWVEYWTCFYHHLLDNYAQDVIFWDYDEFCVNPKENFERLGSVISVNPELLTPFCSKVKGSGKQKVIACDKQVPKQTREVYEKLKAAAL